MLSIQGLIISFMIGVLMYAFIEGLVMMYREHKAFKEDKNDNDELYLARLMNVLDE